MFEIGMDFSTLPEVEALGGTFNRNGIKGDLIEILSKSGVSASRIRLWVDPYDENGESYGAGGCDFNCVAALARRVKAQGMAFMLDFHYSDFWVDPSKQYKPKAWENLDFDGLCSKVYQYTAETLLKLKEMGIVPEYVQVGNEITNGMLWDDGKLSGGENGEKRSGYDKLARLLAEGCRAVRETTAAKIILHLENSSNNSLWREWFDAITLHNIDYDIIGASYYPLWHGNMNEMICNLNDMVKRYKKDVMIVETSYPFTGEHFNVDGSRAPLVIDSSMKCSNGDELPYPLTMEGQKAFMADLINAVKGIDGGSCKAVYYWEPAWLAVEGTTWASGKAREYIKETHKSGGNEWANQCLFDYNGEATPALGVLKELL